MKTIILKITFVLSISFILQGCYTVVWSPENDYPTQYSNDYSGYYGGPVYVDYYHYYDYPWWLNLGVSSDGTTKRDKDKKDIRDTGTGRGTTPRYENPSTGLEIIKPPSPTRNSGGSGNTTSSDGNKKSGEVRSETKSSTSSESGSRNSTSETRGNDNGRNSGNGRK